jgi:ABC-2 type transport system permease protein
VTYVMESLRALLLEDLGWSGVAPGSLVAAVSLALMVAQDVRLIRSYVLMAGLRCRRPEEGS